MVTARLATPSQRSLPWLLTCGLLMMATLAGCNSNTANATCSEFMDKAESDQIDIIVDYNKTTGLKGEMAKTAARAELPEFRDYCGQDEHSDDKIKDLEFSVDYG